jgi:hypothetical protein
VAATRSSALTIVRSNNGNRAADSLIDPTAVTIALRGHRQIRKIRKTRKSPRVTLSQCIKPRDGIATGQERRPHRYHDRIAQHRHPQNEIGAQHRRDPSDPRHQVAVLKGDARDDADEHLYEVSRRGHCSPRLSQNRTGTSRLIRLPLSSRPGIYFLVPMHKHLWRSCSRKSQRSLGITRMTFVSLTFSLHPAHQGVVNMQP